MLTGNYQPSGLRLVEASCDLVRPSGPVWVSTQPAATAHLETMDVMRAHLPSEWRVAEVPFCPRAPLPSLPWYVRWNKTWPVSPSAGWPHGGLKGTSELDWTSTWTLVVEEELWGHRGHRQFKSGAEALSPGCTYGHLGSLYIPQMPGHTPA